MPSWDFFAGIAISESENRIYDIAKDKWLGKDFKYHSFMNIHQEFELKNMEDLTMP